MLYDLERANRWPRDSLLSALTDWLAIALMASVIYLLFHFSFNRRIQRLLTGIAPPARWRFVRPAGAARP